MTIPDILCRYHARAVSDTPVASRCVIEQEGEMRMSEDGGWMPFTAEQWFETTRVAFCWHARVKMAPLVTAVVEDAYEEGHGRLDAKVWGVVPVARARGLDIDRGEVQRYLAELAWNPWAITRNHELRFAEGVDGPVRVWCRDPGTHVDLRFDDDGNIAGTFTRTRKRDGGEPCPWEGVYADHADVGGLRIPTRAEVTWHLPSGPFTYWRGRVTGLTLQA